MRVYPHWSVRLYFDSQEELPSQVDENSQHRSETGREETILEEPTSEEPILEEPCSRLVRDRRPTRKVLESQELDCMFTSQFITTKENKHLKLALKLRQEGRIRNLSSLFVDSRRKEIEGLLYQEVF